MMVGLSPGLVGAGEALQSQAYVWWRGCRDSHGEGLGMPTLKRGLFLKFTGLEGAFFVSSGEGVFI